MSATHLIHLNIEVADEAATAEQVANEVLDALEVGIDAKNTPALWASHIEAPLAEQVA